MDKSEDKLNADRAEEEAVTKLEESAEKTKREMPRETLLKFLKKAALVFAGYIICYMNWSIFLLLILTGLLVWMESKKLEQRNKIASRYKVSCLNKKELQGMLKELSPWVTFPDWERADWLNDIILQLWPNLSIYLIKIFRGPIQKTIKKKYDSFTFEDLDFGTRPPKIDGVKVYNKSTTKESIVIDFDVLYDGDCNIKCLVSGTQIGRIKDFQLSVEVRVILKPLLLKLPLIGGIQVFFLNTPDINFDLEGISGFPGLSYFIRHKIEEQIKKRLVFPNKITKRFSKSIEAAELKSLEPEGVLRVHVFEAKDLEKKDVTGKSDPYVVLNIGAQSYKTEVISRSLNPQWNYWCEFVVLDPIAQQLNFKLFDEDFNEDDFLGRGSVDIQKICKGKTDQWFDLEHVRHGKIHLRFAWLTLSSDYDKLKPESTEAIWLKKKNLSTALLSVFIESAKNLPRNDSHRKPDPYCVATVGNTHSKSKAKKHTTDPLWEQGFSFLVPSPDKDFLYITIMDKHSGTTLIKFEYKIKDLTDKPDLQTSKESFVVKQDDEDVTLVLSLQLRILVNDVFVHEDSESESEDISLEIKKSTASSDSVSRQISIDDAEEELPLDQTSQILRKSVHYSLSATKKLMLGQIELSVNYNDFGQTLSVTVHQIKNLPLKDPSDIPDPYVTLKVVPKVNSNPRLKTKVIMDNCDPIFDETFEFLISKSDLSGRKLIVTIKTKKFFSNKNVMGQVVIELKSQTYLESLPDHSWYDLQPQVMD